MNIDVGSVINLKGKKWVCTHYVSSRRKMLADDRTVHDYSHVQLIPAKRIMYLSSKLESFSPGDIVVIESECLWLRALGEDGEWMTLYTKYNILKETKNYGHERTEVDSTEQTASGEVANLCT